MSIDPVLSAFDEAIESINGKIASYEQERDRLQELRDKTAEGAGPVLADDSEDAAPPPPPKPEPEGQTPDPTPRRFSARGMHYLHQLSEALKRGDKTVSRLRDIIGTSAVTPYLAHLEARGLAKPTGEKAATRGHRTKRRTPVWTWVGGDTSIADSLSDPEDAIQPFGGGGQRTSRPKKRRGTRPKDAAKKGEIKEKVSKALADLNGASFTKPELIRSLPGKIRYGSADAELRRAERNGEIVATGDSAYSKDGRQKVKVFRVATATPATPTPSPQPESSERESRILPGIGILSGRAK